MPLPMLMPIMEDITAMVVMALAMAVMAVMALAMALVITADGTVKDLLMLSPLPMLMPSPLPMLMPMLTHITEDTTDGEVTDSEVTEDTEDTMALVITADGMAKDRPMPSPRPMPTPKLTHITEDTTDMEVME